jgi:hypothetical protein
MLHVWSSCFFCELQIKKNISFVEDHLLNIPTKFSSNWSSGFGEARYQGAKKKPTPNILNFYLKSEFFKDFFNEIYSLCVLNIFDLIFMVSGSLVPIDPVVSEKIETWKGIQKTDDDGHRVMEISHMILLGQVN